MNIFKQMIYSLWNAKAIASWRFQKLTKTIGYTLLLTVIALVPATLVAIGDLQDEMAFLKTTVVNDLPDFEVKDGKLTSKIDGVWERNSKLMYVAIDPLDTLKSSDLEKYPFSFVLKSDQLLYAGNSVTYDSFPVSSFDSKLVRSTFENVLDMMPVLTPVLFVILIVAQMFYQILNVLLLGLMIFFLSRIVAKPLKYSQSFTIGTYSATLPTLFFGITNALNIAIISGQFVFWLTALVIGYLALREIPQKQQTSN
ncbi:MAG: DUF1189 domain-containing protein [Bacilli bacterium]